MTLQSFLVSGDFRNINHNKCHTIPFLDTDYLCQLENHFINKWSCSLFDWFSSWLKHLNKMYDESLRALVCCDQWLNWGGTESPKNFIKWDWVPPLFLLLHTKLYSILVSPNNQQKQENETPFFVPNSFNIFLKYFNYATKVPLC